MQGVKELAGVPVSNTMEEGKVWVTTTRKYKGLEAKAVLLIDVEVSKLTDAVMQRMIYIGGSRANSYLKVAFFEDVEKGGYREIVDALQKQKRKNKVSEVAEAEPDAIQASLPGTRKSVLKLLQMEAEAQ